MTGKDVKPQIIHYTGGDVVLNREQNIVMEAAQFPELQKFVGQELVCTDGTTLLGADDKAGIAIILQAVDVYKRQGQPSHLGERAVQVSRPKSTIRWQKLLDSLGGIRSRSCRST